MKNLKTLMAVLLLVFLLPGALWSQNRKTHIVKEGETIMSIAREYRVTPYNLLRVNSDVKRSEELKPGTVLVIPGAAGDVEQPRQESVQETNEVKEEFEEQQRPLGFFTHKVKRKETLFGISRRYEITEEDIKRYNQVLYSRSLKKGMWLQIPQYPERPEVEEIDPNDYTVHKVQPKETRWSIAHTYGITIDSLVALNPRLATGTNYVAAGQELQVPKPATALEEEVQLYESYTVPAKMTLYSLSKEYGITSQEIIKLNPPIVEANGLKEGMVLRLPQKQLPELEISTENYVFYEVKPKQTIYSLTRQLKVSYEDLKALNPDLLSGLKAGMVLKLPIEKSVDLDVKNSLVLDRIDLLDSINVNINPKILVMLPFRLNRLNVEESSSAAKTIEKSNAMKYSFGLYSGLLVALDSIAELGISVDVKTLDTELSDEKARLLLMGENLSRYDMIFGPLQAKALTAVSMEAAKYDIPVVAPLSSETDLSLSNVFYSVPSEKAMREKMLLYMKGQVTDQKVIIIADNLHELERDEILAHFEDATVVDLTEEEKNIALDLEKFALLLSEEKENWVFVESDNSKLVASISSILNSSNTELTKVRMFTTNKNKAFESDVISGSHLSNLRFTYPSISGEENGRDFSRKYERRFGKEPDRYAIRGFDLGYDLLLKLAYKPDLIEVSDEIGVTEYSANKFNYARDLRAGYYNMASYIMTYDNMRIKEVSSQQ
ncbi:MAG: LysM peptidoglycan-binding domain-containing protein [Flavobacteriaceae bacterium]|nr:LysM peptidoglycan-binding domain-containing protein [Flavobacteriaceae bacterium]